MSWCTGQLSCQLEDLFCEATVGSFIHNVFRISGGRCGVAVIEEVSFFGELLCLSGGQSQCFSDVAHGTFVTERVHLRHHGCM